MVPLETEFAERLAAEATTFAFCWRVVRFDGVALGFTSHDRDLEIEGLVYRSAPGIAPSAIHLSAGLETDSMDVTGALSADAITEADLAAGRYDGAQVELFMTDWEMPETGKLPLMRGQLGTVSHEDTAFSAELRGPMHVLERPVVELLSPECRAELGDPRCRVDMAARKAMAEVSESAGPQSLRVSIVEPAPNAFGYGIVRFLSGANSGLERAILSSASDMIQLSEPPAFACAPGDAIELWQGCDKRFSTCRNRFANAANFQGEPHVPGNDLLTRYPGL